MKKTLLLYISVMLVFLSASAQKDPVGLAIKYFNDARATETKGGDGSRKYLDKLAAKYKQAGSSLLQADTGLKPEKKFVVQSYALAAYGKVQDMLLKESDYSGVLSQAALVVPHIWMQTEKIPVGVKWDSLSPAVIVTQSEFIRYREEYFEGILKAARALQNWRSLQVYAAKYITIVPEPENRADMVNYYKKLHGLYELTYASGMSRDAEACRENGITFFEYIMKKRGIVEDKTRTLKAAVSIDSLFHGKEFNYTDFDNNIKVRTQAAKMFEKLNDDEHAYALYHEVINSGSKSLSVLMGRLNIAASMQDPGKLEEALRPFEEKKYSGELTKDQEKKVRECRQMLKKEE